MVVGIFSKKYMSCYYYQLSINQTAKFFLSLQALVFSFLHQHILKVIMKTKDTKHKIRIF